MQPHHLDAVAAEHEEVVVDTCLFHAEDLCKGIAKSTLHVVGGCHIVALQLGGVGRQQRLAVYLAIGQQRELVDLHDV